jgi:hypothetical protein
MDWFLGIHALKLLKLPVSVVMVGANLQKPKQNSGGVKKRSGREHLVPDVF